MKGSVLIVPCCEPGKGSGHLTRAIHLTKDLRETGKEAYLFISGEDLTRVVREENITTEFHGEKGRNLISFLENFQFDKSFLISEKDIHGKKWELIILDRFQTPREEILRWKEIAPVIGIDEGGPFRDSFDFLIDILVPEKFGHPFANIISPALLKFPSKQFTKKQNEPNFSKILITFGQEDSAGLGNKTALILSKLKSEQVFDITLLRGALSKNREQLPENIRIIENIPELAKHLCEYDLIITHYGITAYEALYAGTPVLLASPTAYHKKLAKTAGFWSVKNIKKCVKRSFFQKLEKYREELAKRYGLDKEGGSLANLINSFSPQINRNCPLCGEDANKKSVVRFSDRTYRRCPKCGVIYMDRINTARIEYEKEYFFESYKRQYGKTYIEDFPNLTAMAKRRLEKIKSLLPNEKERTLLDIGCAYGAFLSAAQQEGFSPTGIDPSGDAVNYVQKTFGINAIQGFFPTPYSPLPTPYSVITLWYVIEHFPYCSAVLDEIKKILCPGGILAFSTPSFSGVSGRSSLRDFLEKSPEDHFTVWSPKTCKKALALAGFKVKKTVISGCHPERFPLFGKFAKSKKSPMYWLLAAISKLFGLGDTFEVYAVLS
ncbi:MAG: methyltransferase domain-containing protein [Treponema sp.]|nr:methyltransferase domain-containing protein [Treponema sp.]